MCAECAISPYWRFQNLAKVRVMRHPKSCTSVCQESIRGSCGAQAGASASRSGRARRRSIAGEGTAIAGQRTQRIGSLRTFQPTQPMWIDG